MLPVLLGLAGAVVGAALGTTSGAVAATVLGAAAALLWNRLSEIGAQQASRARQGRPLPVSLMA